MTNEVAPPAPPATPDEITELPLAETWVGLRDRAEALVGERPEDPASLAVILHEIETLIMEIGRYQLRLNEARYDAERAHSRRFNAAIAIHAKTYSQVTVVRAMAEIDALGEKAEWDVLKAAFHYGEATQKALQTKHYGLMNINKNMQSVMFERGRR